jgi:choice-of-anchor A domain-containing protein
MRILHFLSILTLTLSAPAAAVTKLGDPAAGLKAMQELNLIVLGNLNAQGQEVEGKSFVGGNVTGNGTNWGVGNAKQGSASSSRPTLTVVGDMKQGNTQLNNGKNGATSNVGTPPGMVVGGNVSGLNVNAKGAEVVIGGNLNNFNGASGGSVKVGGKTTGYTNANGSSISSGLGSVFAESLVTGLMAERDALAADLTALSATLASLTLADNPSSIIMGSQGPVFQVAAGGNAFALFSIEASLLSKGQIDFALKDSPLPIVVNVFGDKVVWNANPVGGYNASLNPFIIWNFVDAKVIETNRMVHGSVLAPLAKLTNSTPIEGTVVAREMQMKGEVHLGSYAAGDAFLEAIPEPGTWAMLITGFGMVGAAMRRRRLSTLETGNAAGRF